MDAALAEVKEEVGLNSKIRGHIVGYQKPFVGAAFNLLHGRDLNFYAFFKSMLSSEQIFERYRKAKDNWEISNLVFIPLHKVDCENGTLIYPFDSLMKDCSRHLKGALYCCAKSGVLRDDQ